MKKPHCDLPDSIPFEIYAKENKGRIAYIRRFVLECGQNNKVIRNFMLNEDR